MRTLAALLLVCGLATPAFAHGPEKHATTTPAVLPPGYGPLTFEAPTPGSYRLPALGDAADGECLGVDGAATTLHEAFGDRIVLLSFVYASCSDVAGCPLATAVLHRVQRRLRDEPDVAARLQLVSLSFDPTRDTPEAMRRYGEGFADETVDWRFLTTRSEHGLAPILAAYGQGVQPEYGPDGEPLGSIAHVLRVFLIDRAHSIRNVYSVSFLHPDTLLADVRTVLAEDDAIAAAPPGGHARQTSAAPVPGVLGPGDVRSGYERADWSTRSVSLAARRGEAIDLVGRIARAPRGLPPVPVPADNPLTREKVALGRKLFFDRRLSHNGTFSCAMCHIPEQGFASNETATAVGIEGRTVRRNAPTILNAAYHARLFLDGRETRLEQQVWGPLLAANEMGNPSIGSVLERVSALPDYAGRFERAFPGRGLGMETLGMALASYERTLVAADSPFDRWRYGGEADAVSASARRGFALFTGRAACASCHTIGPEHATLTDDGFHNTGIGFYASMGPPEGGHLPLRVAPGVVLPIPREIVRRVSESRPNDVGRYEVTRDPDDRWAYRTPTLRNIALTAPYMHDGSLATLREVIAFYARGGVPNALLDRRIRPLELQPDEIADLVAFLQSLTGGDVESLVLDAFAAPIGERGAARAPDPHDGPRGPGSPARQ